ncbi:MAG: Glutamine-binding periplasmic protein precursor [Firmicutes bacterium ADurb.Bin373]|nr:transporter substrate-binding domain-containing protein [Bacillota bacterium]OQA07775.1 MAG: Glutamine-binding periplasmic protein precursor [Firmicutes bacterium ADurb.Bin373]
MFKKTRSVVVVVVLLLFSVIIYGCGARDKITSTGQLNGKQFAVPTGTVADQLVLSKFPQAKFQYYNTVLDCCMAVKAGKADAAAYDEPILKNIAAKNPGLAVLPEMITVDNYGFAVAPDNQELKTAIDDVVRELKANGTYDQMMTRWFPQSGSPDHMPAIKLDGGRGVLKLGTAAVTEPFSFVDGSQKVVGFDIELASYVAQKLGMKLEVVNMDFGAMIPSLTAGKVDMIGACITITDERAQKVLFSEPYYQGGIAALVKQ